MVRGFRLINEKGQEYSLMDIRNYCLLTEPSGLGVSYNAEYEKLGYSFIRKFKSIEQGKIPAIINCLYYDNYRKFIDFIEDAESIKLAYKVPYKTGEKEYLRDIEINHIPKSEIQTNGVISESIEIDCLSLWYEEKTMHYNIISSQENVIRWDFRWDSRFSEYDAGNLSLINEGHIPAPVTIELAGRVVNPKIELWVDGEQYQEVTLNTTIEEFEKLLYGTKENDFYILKENTDGTRESLLSLDVIDFANDNVIRIPKKRSCELRISSDNGISNVKVTVFVYYTAV